MITRIWPQYGRGVSSFSFHSLSNERFDQRVGTASGMGAAVGVYHETVAALYDYFIPYSSRSCTRRTATTPHLWQPSVSAMFRERWRSPGEHVDILHRTMFMGLPKGEAHSPRGWPNCLTPYAVP
jgi:hypothetical protein